MSERQDSSSPQSRCPTFGNALRRVVRQEESEQLNAAVHITKRDHADFAKVLLAQEGLRVCDLQAQVVLEGRESRMLEEALLEDLVVLLNRSLHHLLNVVSLVICAQASEVEAELIHRVGQLEHFVDQALLRHAMFGVTDFSLFRQSKAFFASHQPSTHRVAGSQHVKVDRQRLSIHGAITQNLLEQAEARTCVDLRKTLRVAEFRRKEPRRRRARQVVPPSLAPGA